MSRAEGGGPFVPFVSSLVASDELEATAALVDEESVCEDAEGADADDCDASEEELEGEEEEEFCGV